jgi:hypothetical protein
MLHEKLAFLGIIAASPDDKSNSEMVNASQSDRQGEQVVAGLLYDIFLNYRWPMLVSIILSLLAYGQTIFNPLHSIDSYATLYDGPLNRETIRFLLMQGRFGGIVLVFIQKSIGYYGMEVGVSALILSIFLFSHAGLLLCRIVMGRPSTAEMTLFLMLLTLHPFNAEFFHFASSTFVNVFAIWLAALGLYVATVAAPRRKLSAELLGGFLIFSALTIYQTAIVYPLTASLLALVARLSSPDAEGRQGSLVRGPEIRALVVAGLPVPIYLATVRLVSVVTGVEADGRTDLLGLLDIGERSRLLADAVRMALWPWPKKELVPYAGSGILILLLATSAGVLLLSLLRRKLFFRALLCAALLALCLTWSAGATSLSKVVWLVPRGLAPVSAFAAGVIMLGWNRAEIAPAQKLLSALVAFLGLIYVGSSNRVLFDQKRMNLWDMQKANRIIERLEREAGFKEIRSLAILGGRWAYPSPLSTTIQGMNVSALAVSWANLGLVEQATGYRFDKPAESELALAKEHCGSVEPWPGSRSVVALGRLGVVCL